MNKKKILVLILTIVILLLTCYFIFVKASDNKENSNDNDIINNDKKNDDKEEKKLTIVDSKSKSRPYAVMINNNHAAWPHSGLQDAYITYEIVVEGGITRLMALFKDQDTTRIGSVRSSRHYYLDYALENDAIYVHHGWSPQAESDIKSLGINNINGVESAFWRDKTLKVASEHTSFTNIEKLSKYSDSKNFTRDTNKELLLNYSVDEIKINDKENSKIANNIKIRYSSYQTTIYRYDATNNVYKRSMTNNGVEVAHSDYVTKKQYTVKNIIVAKIKNSSMDSYGRQDLHNIGSGDGYYITNGYAVPITWSKSSRSSQTVYKYLTGEEIVVNDGNTYIQIQPIDQDLTISE